MPRGATYDARPIRYARPIWFLFLKSIESSCQDITARNLLVFFLSSTSRKADFVARKPLSLHLWKMGWRVVEIALLLHLLLSLSHHGARARQVPTSLSRPSPRLLSTAAITRTIVLFGFSTIFFFWDLFRLLNSLGVISWFERRLLDYWICLDELSG